MFFGEFRHTMDAKGRVSLPSRHRNQLAGEVVLVKGLEHCLWAFTPDGFQTFLGTLDQREAFDARLRQTRRFFLAGAQDSEIDAAGRIRVPQILRDYAELDKDVVITGNGDRLELWNATAWDEYTSRIDIESLTGDLAADGLL